MNISLCECKERLITECEEIWEPNCDMGNNPMYELVHEKEFSVLDLEVLNVEMCRETSS